MILNEYTRFHATILQDNVFLRIEVDSMILFSIISKVKKGIYEMYIGILN